MLKEMIDPVGYKGKQGEKAIAILLENINGYKFIINNIMINDNGKSRQIDHIAITEYGVFVIETKNYAGIIYGLETSTEWKQYLNNKCFTFKNPIHQNYGHCEIVKSKVKDITNEIESIVVFVHRCKLKVKTISKVIYDDMLVNYILSKKRVLNKEQIDKIYNAIIENSITDEEEIANHNYNVKMYVRYKNKIAEEGICPKCRW